MREGLVRERRGGARGLSTATTFLPASEADFAKRLGQTRLEGALPRNSKRAL